MLTWLRRPKTSFLRSFKMNALKYSLLGFLLYSFCLNVTVAKKKVKLQIVTEFMPEDCPRTAASGDAVEVHYTGTLEDGTVFDSSRAEGRQPIGFQLGSGQVIKGWEDGIVGMCVGEKRKLTIPPHLGYGDKGAGPIPGGATLIFETELVSIQGGSLIPSFDFAQLQRWFPFVGVPLLVCYIVYYLWSKANTAPAPKEKKGSRKKGKRT